VNKHDVKLKFIW